MSELGKLVKQMALDAVASTSPSDLMLGEVVSPLPNLAIKIRNKQNLVIPKELLVVNRDLLSYKRTMNISATGGILTSSSVGDTMTTAGTDSHTHNITSLNLLSTSVSINNATVTFIDELKTGDIVMVESFSGGQMFYVSAIVKTFE